VCMQRCAILHCVVCTYVRLHIRHAILILYNARVYIVYTGNSVQKLRVYACVLYNFLSMQDRSYDSAYSMNSFKINKHETWDPSKTWILKIQCEKVTHEITKCECVRTVRQCGVSLRVKICFSASFNEAPRKKDPPAILVRLKPR